MLHSLTIGHLDGEAVRRGKIHLLRPLDMAVTTQVLREVGTIDEHGQVWLGKARVDFRDGYVVCPWLGSYRHQLVEDFAWRLQSMTGCIVADIPHREVIDLALILAARDSENRSYPLIDRSAS